MPELPQVPVARTHRVRVTAVVAETADARSFVLDPADGALAYRPGQFLTLRLPGPDGEWPHGATPSPAPRTPANR